MVTKQELEQLFRDIKFEEKEHLYTLNNNVLVSTSHFIKQFSKPYDSYIMSNVMAKSFNKNNPNYEPRTNKYYLSRWKDIKDTALAQGTKVHNYALYNYPHFNDDPDCEKETGVVEFFRHLDKSRYEVICLELKMYMKPYLRAGTTDIVILDKETNTLIIADWKTGNKDIFSSYGVNKMLDPFSELNDNNYHKYSLQLSDYKNMIQYNTNYKVSELWIIHLTTKEFEDKPKYTRIEVDPFMKGKYYRTYKAVDFSDKLLPYYKTIDNEQNI